MRASAVWWAFLFVGATSAHAATEDMDFVAEHLPEAAMDNRLLSLPLDFADNLPREQWSADLGALAERIESGNVRLSGPGVGLGLRRQVSRSWAVLGAAFFDHLALSGDTEARPVAPVFSTSFPISLPANAVLGNQRGNVDLSGLGVAMRYQPAARPYAFTFGALRQNVKLDGYRVDYRLVDGPSAGTSGTLDYSTDYSFWVPFATFRVAHARTRTAARAALLGGRSSTTARLARQNHRTGVRCGRRHRRHRPWQTHGRSVCRIRLRHHLQAVEYHDGCRRVTEPAATRAAHPRWGGSRMAAQLRLDAVTRGSRSI